MKKKKVRLTSAVKGYIKPTLLSPLFVALEVVMEIIIPLVISDVINVISKTDDAKVHLLGFISDLKPQYFALSACGILILLALLSLTFGILSGIFAARASAGFAKNLRQMLYYKVQDFSFENIDKFSTSSLITRTTTDVTNVQNAFQMLIRIAVRSPFMLIFSLIMAITINSRVSMVFLYVLPVLIVGLGLVMKIAHGYFKKMFRTFDDLNTVVQENVAGARTVKAFVREDFETEKFKQKSKAIYKYASNAERAIAFNGPLMQASIYFCMLFVAVVGSTIAAETNMLDVNLRFTAGDLNTFTTYIMQILMSLMMLSMIIIMLVMAKTSLDRISEVINEEPSIKNIDEPVFEVKDGSIDFDHVGFAYTHGEDKEVLHDINIHIKSGMTVGIVGGTGSAKTSLVNLIPRLYDISTGSLKIGGIEVKNYDIKTLRDQVAIVLQKNVLFSGTIASNLRWGNKEATLDEIKHAAELAQAEEFISRFPDLYDSRIDQGGANVSGGQRQRLCIARALLKKPKILILDDSTSAVDTKTDALIRKAFKEEIPDTTKIIIAQRISSVEDADMIIVLDDGHINGIGTHKELVENNEIYKDIYISQVKGAGARE